MKIKTLPLFISVFCLVFCSSLLSSCQTAKQAEDAEENQVDKITLKLEQEKKDSLQIAFCNCLVEDSVNKEQKLQNIDSFISQNIDINIPCSFEEEVVSHLAETALLNMGVAISNRVLLTKFKKRTSKVNTILKNYPVLMLFSEDTTMIRELVARGAILDNKTIDVVSLPEHYVIENDLKSIEFVIDLGAKIEEIRLFTSNEKTLDFLIAKGAKIDNIDKVSLFEKENYRALKEKYKIDLSKTTCEEFNQLSKVTQFQKISFERTKWLLENKTDASCIDKNFLEDIINKNFDERILTKTARKSNQPTQKKWIELMGEYAVNWNQCASFGKNPLMLAVEKHDIELIKLLLSQKANPDFACNFAGRQETAKHILEEKIISAQKNEVSKREREGKKYNKKDEEKHAVYMNRLNEIKVLLE